MEVEPNFTLLPKESVLPNLSAENKDSFSEEVGTESVTPKPISISELGPKALRLMNDLLDPMTPGRVLAYSKTY